MIYSEAQALFSKARNKSKGKPLSANLRLVSVVRHGRIDYAIKHHATEIITINPDNSVELNNGGWFSVTTKKHLNTYLPSGAYLYQRNHDWFIQDASGQVSEYYNGIKISELGNIISEIIPVITKAKRKYTKRAPKECAECDNELDTQDDTLCEACYNDDSLDEEITHDIQKFDNVINIFTRERVAS